MIAELWENQWSKAERQENGPSHQTLPRSFAAGRIALSYLPRFEIQRLKNLDFDLESLIFSASDSEGNAYLLVAI